MIEFKKKNKFNFEANKKLQNSFKTKSLFIIIDSIAEIAEKMSKLQKPVLFWLMKNESRVKRIIFP